MYIIALALLVCVGPCLLIVGGSILGALLGYCLTVFLIFWKIIKPILKLIRYLLSPWLGKPHWS